MKNLLFLTCLLFLISCKTSQHKTSSIKKYHPLEKSVIKELMYDKGYSLKIPENWHSYLDVHSSITYSPKKFKLNSKKSSPLGLRCYQSKTKKSLENYVENLIQNRKKYISNFRFEKEVIKTVKYGNRVILKYDVTYFGVKTTYLYVIFRHQETVYELNFTCDNSLYKDYIDDALLIIDSFKIIQ